MDGVCGGLLGRSRSRSRSRKWRVDQHSSTFGKGRARGEGGCKQQHLEQGGQLSEEAVCFYLHPMYCFSATPSLRISPDFVPREMMTSPSLPSLSPSPIDGEFTRALDLRNRNSPSKQERGARTGFFPYSHRHFQLRIGIVVPLKQNDSGPQPKH